MRVLRHIATLSPAHTRHTMMPRRMRLTTAATRTQITRNRLIILIVLS